MSIGPGPIFFNSINSELVGQLLAGQAMNSLMTNLPCALEAAGSSKQARVMDTKKGNLFTRDFIGIGFT
jgi:hypothetical protein